MIGNPVRFIYISAGKERPTPIDPDAIYFMEGDKQIWVGNSLISDHVDPIDIESYLEPYRVKDIAVVGQGSVVSDVNLNDSTGRLTFTKSDISISKGVSPAPTEVDLQPGGQFTVMSETTVSGSTIYDQLVKFKLPAQITSVSIRKIDSGSTVLSLDATLSDGTTTSTQINIFGSSAFADSSDFATAEQGVKADAAMPSVDGTATGAHVSLAADPVDDLDAATKQYVDRTVSDSIAEIGTPFNYRGDSSTPITDGGREEPTIDGEPIDPTQGMKKGDVVTYDGKEFVWTGEHWQAFGDEGSYALKTIRVDGGDGLTGGGDLVSDIVIQHGATGSGESHTYSSEGFAFISEVSVDKFGHVTSAATRDISDDIREVVEEVVGESIHDEVVEVFHEEVEPIIGEMVAEQVAEQVPTAVEEAIEQHLSEYATEAEVNEAISDAVGEIESDIAEVKQELEGDIASAVSDLEQSISDAEDSAKSYTDEQIALISTPEYSVIEVADQTGTYDKIYRLTKDGSPIQGAADINIPKSGGGGGGGSYTAGQGLDISGDVILHKGINNLSVDPDVPVIGFTDTEVDSQDPNTLIFTKRELQRDGMGHLISAQDKSGSSTFRILSEEGVRQMILEYIPTWIIDQSDSDNSWIGEPATSGGIQTGNTVFFSGSSSEPFVLNYSPVDSSIGRNWPAAWAGVNILAPKYVTSENISKFKYDRDGNTGIGTDSATNKSFASGNDGMIGDRYYMGVWVPLTADNIRSAIATHSTIYRSYSFYNEDTPNDKTTFRVEISPENITLLNTQSVPNVDEIRVVNWEEVVSS